MTNNSPQWSYQATLPMDKDDRRIWVMDRAREAKAEGARTMRYAISDDYGVILLEGWDHIVKYEDMPEPFFHLQYKEAAE